MSLNYNIIDALKLLSICFKYKFFIAVLISALLFIIILKLNEKRKYTKYLVMLLNIILIVFISYYYIKNIFSFKFSNPINNIYFYFFNSIIFLILYAIFKKNKIIDYLVYGVSLLNIIYSIFMTKYLYNLPLIVIGNIFPMIKFGNIIYIIYYILLLYRLVRRFLTKKI